MMASDRIQAVWTRFRRLGWRDVVLRVVVVGTIGILCPGQGCPTPADSEVFPQPVEEPVDSTTPLTDGTDTPAPTTGSMPESPTDNSPLMNVSPGFPDTGLTDGVVDVPTPAPNPDVDPDDVPPIADPGVPPAPEQEESKPDESKGTERELLDIVEIKFYDGYQIRLVDGRPVDLNRRALTGKEAQVLLKDVEKGKWSTTFSQDEKMLNYLRGRASSYWGYKTADLNLFFRLVPPEGMDAEKIRQAFEMLGEVEMAMIAPKPEAPPAPSVDYSVGSPSDLLQTPLQYQGYLDSAADGGIDARYAWTQPGGLGQNVNVVDLEYGWTPNHEDLPGLINMDPDTSMWSGNQDFIDHGDASLGVIVGRDNGFGVKGIAPQATPFVKAVGEGNNYNVADAILQATAQLDEGDIMLIEQQISRNIMSSNGTCSSSSTAESIVDCPFQRLPVEWHYTNWVAIHTAVGNGMIVVEPAGNGGQNLNVLGEELAHVINGGHDPFAVDAKGFRISDSGAILVGNGLSPRAEAANVQFDTARTRNLQSNYGECVDVQGWGDSIVTLGYGDLFNEGAPARYTSQYRGTSGASAIVAGAAASLQSIAKQIRGEPMPPYELRALLKTTGTPGPQHRGPMGPLPDLRAAIDYVMGGIEPPTLVTPYDIDGPPLTPPYSFGVNAPSGWDPNNVLILLTLNGTDPDDEGLGYDEGGVGYEFAPGETLNFNYSVLVKYRSYLRRKADGSLFAPGEHPMSEIIEVPLVMADGTVPTPIFSVASGTYTGAQFLTFSMPAEFTDYEIWVSMSPNAAPGEPYPGGPTSFRYNGASLTIPVSSSWQPVYARAYAVTSSSTGVPSASVLAQQLYMINP